MKQKQLKTAAILITALVLATSTVWAAAHIGVLKGFFTKGDMSSLEEHVINLDVSVTDGRYKVTLEEVIALQNRAAFIYSVAGVTDDAKVDLMSANFNGSVTVELPKDSGAYFNTMSQYEMEDMKTSEKKFFYCFFGGLENPEELPVTFGLNIMANEDKYIEIPLDTTAELLDLTLRSPSGTVTSVVMSPIDVMVEKDVTEGYEDMVNYLDMSFRMADGTVKTINQLFEHQSSTSIASDDYLSLERLRYRHSYIAHEMIDYSEFKSIIIGNIEYDINDTTQIKEVEISEQFTPVLLSTVYHRGGYLLLLEEAVEKLGGEITFDPPGKSVVIQYRGSTVEIQEGEKSYRRDGTVTAVKYDYDQSIVVTADGIWLMEPFAFREYFKVGYYTVFKEETEFVEGVGYVGVCSTYLIP